MNKPSLPPSAVDSAIGPVDANGEQVWSSAEAAVIARLQADPDYHAAIDEGLADFEAGRVLTHEEVMAASTERRRRWRAEHGL